MFGGKRIPITGRSRGDVPDIDHPLFAIEVKCAPSHPKRIMRAMEQAEKAAKGKIPLVTLHEWNKHYDNDLIVIKAKHFLELINGTS